MNNSMVVDGVFASEALDSSGEVLDVKGVDVSTIESGSGFANFEHNGADGKGNGNEIIGKITHIKKIFSEEDCEDGRQLMFWRRVRLPLIYGKVRLYDGANHPSAVAIAAIIRDSFANNEPVAVGFSIEGSTLKKEKNVLKKTVAKRVALTLKSCNKTAYMGLIADPNAPEGFDKEYGKPDLLAMLPRQHKVVKNEDPMYQTLGGSEAVYGTDMLKTMTAGGLNAAPSTHTGGTALVQTETLGSRAVKLFKTWDKKKPLKEFMKSHMPEVSDEFLEHFERLIDDHQLKIKKAEDDARKREPLTAREFLNRAKYLTVELAKAIREGFDGTLQKADPAPAPEHVQFQGKTVKPGLATHKTSKDKFAILDSTPDAFVAVPHNKLSGWDHSDMVKIPKNHADIGFWNIHQHPQDVGATGMVHKDRHGVQGFMRHDDVADMVHGLDLSGPIDRRVDSPSVNQDTSGWMQGPKGKVYVKANPKEMHFGEARSEAAYHNLARDFFGMGQYLPKVGLVSHPATGQEHAVVEHIPGGHFDSDEDDHGATLHQLNNSGELHKLTMMNMLLQNPDRHQYNYLMTPDKSLKLIDHGLAFSWANEPRLPHYQRMATPDPFGELVHPKAREWAQSLNPHEFQLQMQSHGIPKELADESVNRLKALQQHLQQNPQSSIGEAHTQPQLMASSGFTGRDLATGK